MNLLVTLIARMEEDYLKMLITYIENNRFSVLHAKTITAAFLALYPFSALDDLKDKIQRFASQYPDFAQLNARLANYLEETKVNDVLTKMRAFMAENKVDEAVKAATG